MEANAGAIDYAALASALAGVLTLAIMIFGRLSPEGAEAFWP